MKYHNVLQAHSSLRAYNKHLRVYVKIDILEQGKVLGTEKYLLTKNISNLTNAEK